MKLLLNFFLLVFSICTVAQNSTTKENLQSKVEEFIIYHKNDSVFYYLDKVESTSLKELYKKLINKEQIAYSAFYSFISRQGNKHSLDYDDVSNFINNYLEEPTDTKKINLDYVEIKWTQVGKLRDEVSLEKASLEQKKLENYINKFNDSDNDVLRAKTKINTHPIVMYLIEKDINKGKELCLKSLEITRKLKDKSLEISFLYHLSDFLVLEGKLEEYIKISEQSLQIEKELPRPSSYYHSTLEHLIDAYIYKRGNNERVNALLDEMYNDSTTRIQTYSLYLKLIAYSGSNSAIKNEVFKKFEVSNVKELIEKFKTLGKDLNSNDFFHILLEGSRALQVNNYYDEALSLKDEAIAITRKIYSEDLSNSLANFKTEQAVKEKDKEVLFEKEKTKLYSIITILAVLFLIISIFIIIEIKKQSKKLSEKNRIINKTLKEKELLVKEVHHRVKNNFQIVSSLLELQSRGIEDEKALELANEGKNRVKSMALIHQKLYQNETGLVDFDEYIQQLTKELSSLYDTSSKIETKISSKNMMFDVDTAIPLGLIINEIITNSYKYAFNKDKENKLSIAISKNDNEDYKLVIEDNGPGISDSLDVKKAKSLGLRLVNRLVKQLHGKLLQTNKNGARFEIFFKDHNARQFVN